MDGLRELSLGNAADPWRASHARFQRLPGHRVALPAGTRQTANTIVSDTFSQSNQCVRRQRVFRGVVEGIRSSAFSVLHEGLVEVAASLLQFVVNPGDFFLRAHNPLLPSR
jgi:hypothetical protein